MNDSIPFDGEAFLGEATDVQARVYVRPNSSVGDGTIEGPFCEYAHTLRVTIPLRELESGPAPLAEAVIPDPCFWTPQMPFFYRLTVEGTKRTIGLRRLATKGDHLVLDGKRYVVRGVAREDLTESELQGWHDEHVALVLPNPSDAVCEAASRVGVLLLADQRHQTPAAAERDSLRLARWPAVGVIVLSAETLGSIKSPPRGALVAQRFAAGESVELAQDTDMALCEMVAEGTAKLDFPRDVPVAVLRTDRSCESPIDVRVACDRLQRDLAPQWGLAGYLV